MEEKEVEFIKLSEDEINVIKEYQKTIDGEKASLGGLRLQFLSSEQDIIEKIKKAHGDFLSHLKVLSQSKNVPTDGEWVFDPTAFVFRKKM